METLAQIAKKIRSGLKVYAGIGGLAFSVRVIGGILSIEITQVRSGFKVLNADGSLTRPAVQFRQAIEGYARAFLKPYDGLLVRYSDAILKAEEARIAGGQ